ncbi:unnamed protein product [Urochloa humidicola]
MTEARLARFRCLALLLLGLVPVLPLPNPDTGISHHIIRLIDSTYHDFKVDLLFRDCDLYFAGFRRAVVSPEGEEQWGEWFIFNDLVMDGTAPAYLNAVKMGISSAHRGKNVTRPGGDMAMDDIFQTLSHFQDHVDIVDVEPRKKDAQPRGDKAENEPTEVESEGAGTGRKKKPREARMSDEKQDSLGRVVARVIVVFSEALRLRSVYKEVLKRLTELQWSDPTTLDRRLWNLIHDWGQASDHVQETLKLEGALDDLGAALPNKFIECAFPTMTMGDLIGPAGELMVAKSDQTHISMEALQRRRDRYGAANVQEPGFPIPNF